MWQAAVGWCKEVLLRPPSAGVGAVGMDRRAAAPPGERAPGAGRTAHHRGCNPMDCSMSAVHQQLPELAQTHVHQVSDAIQPSLILC